MCVGGGRVRLLARSISHPRTRPKKGLLARSFLTPRTRLKKRYGDTSVDTSEIPYATGFDEQASSRTERMSDFVASWGTPENLSPRGNPMYMFGAEYTMRA